MKRTTEDFVRRQRDGQSYFNYTFKSVCKFLERNGLVSIIRSHEMNEAGCVESFHVSPEFPVGSNCV